MCLDVLDFFIFSFRYEIIAFFIIMLFARVNVRVVSLIILMPKSII